MSWFDEQIDLRRRSDREAFEDSCLRIAGSVMGKRLSASLYDKRELTTNAVEEILKYYRVKRSEIPEKASSMDELLEILLRPSGIMTREVRLEKGWYENAAGAMLTTFKSDGSAVALIPTVMGGYKYTDRKTGKRVFINHRNEGQFSDEAILFYKPFPNKKMKMRDLYNYILDNLDKNSLICYILFTLFVTLTGVLLPGLTKNLLSVVPVTKNTMVLPAIAIFMISASLSGYLFGTIQRMFLKRMSLKLNFHVESATMMRILSLPGSFFKNYAAGDLASRVHFMTLLVDQLVDQGFAALVTALFSFVYLFQSFSFAPALAVPAIVVSALTLIVILLSIIARSGVTMQQMELEAEENGLSYALVSGVEKIKLSGAERRAFAKWGRSYSEQAVYLYDPPLLVKVSGAVITSISLIGMIVIYYAAIFSNVDTAEYYAFITAYGMAKGALDALALMIVPTSHVAPIMEMVRPIIEAEPEVSEEKPVIKKLSGGIELNSVSFRYKEDMPPVLDDISLRISPGQYVAVTGETGCGKSTLMRILLGFEMPQRGAVFYDGKDVRSVDLKSLRTRIGIVMQNDTLFTGDIFSNITISDPSLTLEDAWEAAEISGLADDIRSMPMGMFTQISEGSGSISGGQRQRLMIARAIAPKPNILMFDEATNALDNITQKRVSDALDKMKCTRIIIAHRLSTIMQCDRIIVLKDGKVVEDGRFEELMEKNGCFTRLAGRQQV